MKKKQELAFKGVGKSGLFVTNNFEHAAIVSNIDPVPLNRKSTKAMNKIIEGLESDEKKQELKAYRVQKKKRERAAQRKRSYLSRRTNSKRKRL